MSPSAMCEDIRLSLKQFVVSQLIAVEALELAHSVRAAVGYRIESMACQLTAEVTVPSRVLQQDRLVFNCPASPWQALRKRLGLYYERYECVLSEYVLYPYHTLDIGQGAPIVHIAHYVEDASSAEGT